jgi:DNA repair protein RecN (Recombination protein N)
MRKSAEVLSKARSDAALRMSDAVTAELAALSMPNACVSVDVQTPDYDDVRNYHSHGVDEIGFLFAPHTGSKLASLAKIASGGEMSRLMLAIEVVIAAKAPVGTYVFDEVDAGVGGKAAVEVGRRLAALAKSAQVIVVTHLPQVAAWADNHLVVIKDQSGSITESSVVKLKKEERLREIARMLAGQEDSQTAQKHAEELLEMVSKSVIS